MRISDAKIEGVSSVTPPVMISAPSPRSEATNSPTIAPITLIVALSFKPVKMYGTAFGKRIFMKTCQRLARSVRTRSSISGSAVARPTAVLTTIGKNAIVVPMTMFGQTP
jgi:hypothetical protein